MDRYKDAAQIERLRKENGALRDAMALASAMLKSPPAEYVPVMSEAWEVLEKALATHRQ